MNQTVCKIMQKVVLKTGVHSTIGLSSGVYAGKYLMITFLFDALRNSFTLTLLWYDALSANNNSFLPNCFCKDFKKSRNESVFDLS